MNIQLIRKDKLEYVIIDEFYNNKEMSKIKQEFEILKSFLLPSESLKSAFDKKTKKILKTGKGLFLNNFYSLAEQSFILIYSRKFFSEEVYNEIEKLNIHFKHIRQSTFDNTLINFYDYNDEYLAHTDNSIFTSITLFKTKDLIGGELCFPEYNEIIEFKENRLILFPGCLKHQSLPIKQGTKISIANFINYST
jgi:hypothetical protein